MVELTGTERTRNTVTLSLQFGMTSLARRECLGHASYILLCLGASRG